MPTLTSFWLPALGLAILSGVFAYGVVLALDGTSRRRIFARWVRLTSGIDLRRSERRREMYEQGWRDGFHAAQQMQSAAVAGQFDRRVNAVFGRTVVAQALRGKK